MPGKKSQASPGGNVRVLVSGFEAFGGEAVNPTALLVEALRSENAAKNLGQEVALPLIPDGLTVHSVCLPVAFSEAFDVLKAEMDEFRPDVVLALGQAGGRSAIEIERVAINCIDAEIADNRGETLVDQSISLEGPSAFFTTLPMRKILLHLTGESIPARISNTAGTFVCNYLFYKLQEYSRTLAIRTGFIHVPYLPEQTVTKPLGTPNMSFADLKRATRAILAALP